MAFEPIELLPKFSPLRTRISEVKAQDGVAADEPFCSDIGGLLPIALCGRMPPFLFARHQGS